MRRWAQEAKFPYYTIMGFRALSAEDPRVGQGVWLLFEKKDRGDLPKE